MSNNNDFLVCLRQTFWPAVLSENDWRKCYTDLVAAPAVLLITFYFSTFGFLFTFIFLLLLLPSSCYILQRYVYQANNNKINSPFYLSWTISSLVILLIIFEFVVVPFLEISIWENYTLLLIVTLSVSAIGFIRHRNQQQHQHQAPMLDDDRANRSMFYSQWLDTHVHQEQFKLYMFSSVLIIGALLFGAYLSMTTICHTYLALNFLLVPDDCSEIYFDIHLSLSFVAAIYAIMLACTISYCLFQRLYSTKLIRRYHPVAVS